MRVVSSTILLLFLEEFLTSTTTTHAFSVTTNTIRSSPLTQLAAESETQSASKVKPTSAADILARAREASGLPDEDEPPKLFDDSLYEDMRQCLLTLEKRSKEGPSSLSLMEVENFDAMMRRIIVDMKSQEAERVNGLGAATASASPAIAPTPSVETSEPSPEVEVLKTEEIVDLSEDEGPAWDGKGGMGMAKGTRNTYVIPGMDEMSPEEYRKALQKSVSDRQRQRKRDGTYGNRATWDYLNNLTGETGVLKKQSDEE